MHSFHYDSTLKHKKIISSNFKTIELYILKAFPATAPNTFLLMIHRRVPSSCIFWLALRHNCCSFFYCCIHFLSAVLSVFLLIFYMYRYRNSFLTSTLFKSLVLWLFCIFCNFSGNQICEYHFASFYLIYSFILLKWKPKDQGYFSS